MAGDLTLAMLLRADANQAKAEIAATSAEAKKLAGATRETGEAARAATPPHNALSAAEAKAATEARRLAQEAGRAASPLNAARTAARGAAEGMKEMAAGAAMVPGPLAGITARLGSAAGALVSMRGLAIGAGAALGGLTLIAARGVRAFAEYERQMFTVQAVITATGGAAGRTADDIDRLARDIGRSTLASTSGVREAAAQVMTFRSISGQAFDDTLRLAQDLAATGFGSISSAAVQLAKALEDPEQGLSALRRVGVSFSASQVEMIRNFQETGRVAEAQAMILRAVEAQVGGAGEAAGGGLAGSFDTLTEASGRWFELVGKRVSDLIRLEAGLKGVAASIEGMNDVLAPRNLLSEFEAVETRRQQMLARRAALQAEADNPARRSTNLFSGNSDLRANAIAAELSALNEAIVRETERSVAMQRNLYAEGLAAARSVALAKADADRERFEGVRDRLQRELELAAMTALERQQLNETRKAGVTLMSDEGQEIARIVAATQERTNAERELAEATRRAETDGRQASQRLADLRQENELRAATLQYGQDSVEVADLQAAAAKRALEEWLETLTVSEDLKSELRDAHDEGAKLAGLDMASGISAAADEARRLAQDMGISYGAALALRNLGPQGLGERDKVYSGRGGDPRTMGAEKGGNNSFGFDYFKPPKTSSGRGGGGGGRGRSEADRERESVEKLIEKLRDERDVLRETDPVRQELLRYRRELAAATPQEARQIEELIRLRHEEASAIEALKFASESAGSALIDALMGGANAGERLIETLKRAALEALILGKGPLAGLFGTAGSGIFDGLAGAFFPVKKKDGGRIDGPGGPRDDKIPAMLSNGEYVINAAATAQHLPLIEAINSGRPLRLAAGGMAGMAAPSS
ncbi:MAG: phage tail length tape measure family protein [Pseudorhodobacter sp.]